MAPAVTINQNIHIIDIRGDESQFSLVDDVRRSLQPAAGIERTLPTMLLYDETGLKLFEDITYLEEYYLTNAEIGVLKHHAGHIAERIPHGAQIVELGSGNLRKVNILLKALDHAGKDVDYFALDLSLAELQRTLSKIPPESFDHVRCHGLHGTYEDGLEWLKRPENQRKPKCIMTLGSSIGNFGREEASAFLERFAQILGPEDIMIVAVDGTRDLDKVSHAYNDREGVTNQFYRNGLTHANKLLCETVFDQEDWDIVGAYNELYGRHETFISPRKEVAKGDFCFARGEQIRFENAHKYSAIQKSQLWHQSGLHLGTSFSDPTGNYSVNLLSVSAFRFSPDPNSYAASTVPSIKDWEALWAAWDLVTRSMIPEDELLSKPINLRNCCLFYLGHMPTFLDIHLTRATGGKPTEPRLFAEIFERGIDPDVENPELCHDHSEIPDEWPPLEEILSYQERVRERARGSYKDQSAETDRNLGRALWLGFEHEGMHLETLLYMLLQSDKTVPPPGVKPDFEALSYEAQSQGCHSRWIKIPKRDVEVGLTDPENNEGPDGHFGWDNEKPIRKFTVSAFESQLHAITNREYAQYLIASAKKTVPASWTTDLSSTTQSNGVSTKSLNGIETALPESFLRGKTVKTVHGPVHLEYTLDWPVMGSYDELAGCAAWMGGRIPTMEEARSIYAYVDEMDTDVASNVCARKIPAVNGHLSNDGVEETPPSIRSSRAIEGANWRPPSLDPTSLYADLSDCNVGFKAFHPVPVNQNGEKLAGLSGMGGVWEWTSSVLEPWKGFEAMKLYPGYTADFFDGKHNIVLGGSWATHPRIAGRKSFLNWYQRNYQYAWVGARVVRDL